MPDLDFGPVYYGTDIGGDTVGPAFCRFCAPNYATWGGNPETDTPEHCDGCGYLLDTRLTDDGYRYVVGGPLGTRHGMQPIGNSQPLAREVARGRGARETRFLQVRA